MASGGTPRRRVPRHMVHEYVLRVRAALGDATLISTRAPGYTVAPAAGELDAASFDVLVQEARRAREATCSEDALRSFDAALGLWRGDALCDVALEGNARAAADSLDDQRRTVAAERVDLALALGRHHELIPDLERALAQEPLDERARGQLMLALYRDGRQSEALERYRAGRRRLVDEVGVEPGSDLRALEQAILRQDPSLALETPAGEARAERGSRAGRRAFTTCSAEPLPFRRRGACDRRGFRRHDRGDRCDARCRRGRARQRRRGRDRGRDTRPAPWIDFDRLTSRRDCLRLEVSVGLGPRLVVAHSNLAILASRDRDGAVAPRRAEPDRGRRTTLGGDRRQARGHRPDGSAHRPDVRQRFACHTSADCGRGRKRLTRRARSDRSRRAALGTPDMDRRTRWADARADGHQRGAECHRRRLRQHVACISRGGVLLRSTPTAPQRGFRSDAARPPSWSVRRRLGRRRARRYRQADRPRHELADHDDRGGQRAERDRDRRRQRMGGQRRRRHADADRPAQPPRHRDREGRRQPTSPGCCSAARSG